MSDLDKKLEELVAQLSEDSRMGIAAALAAAVLRARKALDAEETVYRHVVGAEAWQMGKDPAAQKAMFRLHEWTSV